MAPGQGGARADPELAEGKRRGCAGKGLCAGQRHSLMRVVSKHQGHRKSWG